MPNLNKCYLMGNLTRDPELRYTPNNTAVCAFGMAINRTWFDKSKNEKQEEVAFIDLEAWGKTAENLNKYLRKGDPLFVEGRLKLDQWEDQGQKRSKLKVVVEQMQFIGGRKEQRGGGGEDEPRNYPTTGPHKALDDEDVPF